MSEPQRDILTDHAYDGIQEYDNPTPGWWNWLFIATVVFSAIYFFTVTFSGGQLAPTTFYDRYQTENMQKQYGTLGDVKPDAPSLLRLLNDPKWLKVGGTIYQTHCVTCHGRDGEGLAGPNLTDDAYVHIKKIDDICDVIAKGRSNGAMPAWSTRLQPTELVLVSSYVASLRGQNKPGKPPEGQPAPAWK